MATVNELHTVPIEPQHQRRTRKHTKSATRDVITGQNTEFDIIDVDMESIPMDHVSSMHRAHTRAHNNVVHIQLSSSEDSDTNSTSSSVSEDDTEMTYKAQMSMATSNTDQMQQMVGDIQNRSQPRLEQVNRKYIVLV